MRNNWLRSTGRCPPSSTREKPWRTPTPTLKSLKTWAWLRKQWSTSTKKCKWSISKCPDSSSNAWGTNAMRSLLFFEPSLASPHSICGFDAVCPLSRGVDNVDDLMAEIAEQQDLALEISEAISKPYGFNEDFDEVRVAQRFSLLLLLLSGEHLH